MEINIKELDKSIELFLNEIHQFILSIKITRLIFHISFLFFTIYLSMNYHVICFT